MPKFYQTHTTHRVSPYNNNSFFTENEDSSARSHNDSYGGTNDTLYDESCDESYGQVEIVIKCDESSSESYLSSPNTYPSGYLSSSRSIPPQELQFSSFPLSFTHFSSSENPVVKNDPPIKQEKVNFILGIILV